jgi:lysophospholipase L1-like esterase
MRDIACFFALILCITASAVHAADPVTLKFDFGCGKAPPGWTQIAPTNFYSVQAGCGFELGAAVVAGDGFVASTNPFYFSVRVPEGNYRVTAALGGSTAESTMTVKAELRRLMLEKVHVAPGKTVTRSFIVNVRMPQISGLPHQSEAAAGGGEVRLKPREQTNEWWAWDEKLTLEFNGTHPGLRSLEIERAAVPTVFLLGDSTVCDQAAEPWNSWGQMLPRFFKPEIAVANHAESGETVGNSLRAQRFEKVFSLMKSGDYLFIQFGHNDMKNRATNALEVYKSDLKKVVAETRAKGGTPVLVTAVERKGGLAANTLAGYPDAVREVAREEKCALIDLNSMSVVLYRALGTNLDLAFQDPTHHNNYGSYELAQCVVEGIKQDKLPLAKFIADDFKGFDPAHPDPVDRFQMPASPQHSDIKPPGY